MERIVRDLDDAPEYSENNVSESLEDSAKLIAHPEDAMHIQEKHFNDCIERISELIEITEEKYSYCSYGAYQKASCLCHWKSDIAPAMVWAERELGNTVALFGSDSPIAERTKAWIEFLEEEESTEAPSEPREKVRKRSEQHTPASRWSICPFKESVIRGWLHSV